MAHERRRFPREVAARTSRVDTPRHGRPDARARPCTVLRPDADAGEGARSRGHGVALDLARGRAPDGQQALDRRTGSAASARRRRERAPRPARRDRPPGPRSPARSSCRRRGPSSVPSLLRPRSCTAGSPGYSSPNAHRTRPQTPAMQQYHRMKAEHPDALLFFRMGDFYELFFEDAVVAARALEIALTSRSKDRGRRAHPHVRSPPPRRHRLRRPPRQAGLPRRPLRADGGPAHRQGRGQARGRPRHHPGHAARGRPPWTRREAVFRARPRSRRLRPRRRLARRHHRRVRRRAVGRRLGRWDRLRDDLGATRPARAPGAAREPPCRPGSPTPPRPKARSRASRAGRAARSTRDAAVASCSPTSGSSPSRPSAATRCPAPSRPAAAALRYVRDTQKRDLTHVTSLRHPRPPTTCLVIDALTRRNLELVENLVDGSAPGHAARRPRPHRAPPWARACCGEWILRPAGRAGAASRTASTRSRSSRSAPSSAAASREALGDVQDLDRILGRVTPGHGLPARPARARALAARRCPRPRAALDECQAPLVRSELKDLDPPLDVAEDIEAHAGGRAARPPCARAGSCATASTRSSTSSARSATAAAPPSPPSRSGSARAPASRSLKVRFNRVFGYYIEVSKSNLGARARRLHPQADDRGRRALRHPRAQGVRGEGPARPTSASSSARREIFEALRARVAAQARAPPGRPRAAAATLDVLASLAEVACRATTTSSPASRTGDELSYVEGRHPDHGARPLRAVRGQRPRAWRRTRRASSS